MWIKQPKSWIKYPHRSFQTLMFPMTMIWETKCRNHFWTLFKICLFNELYTSGETKRDPSYFLSPRRIFGSQYRDTHLYLFSWGAITQSTKLWSNKYIYSFFQKCTFKNPAKFIPEFYFQVLVLIFENLYSKLVPLDSYFELWWNPCKEHNYWVFLLQSYQGRLFIHIYILMKNNTVENGFANSIILRKLEILSSAIRTKI